METVVEVYLENKMADNDFEKFGFRNNDAIF